MAASLSDTFFVRTLLVPALMFFAVETNWWPGRVPPPTRTELVGGTEQQECDSDAEDGEDGVGAAGFGYDVENDEPGFDAPRRRPQQSFTADRDLMDDLMGDRLF